MNKNLSLINKVFLLKKTPLFSTLSLEMLLPIADKLVIADFDAGDEIFNIGEEAHRMYFIVQGEVDLFIKDKKIVQKCKHGDFFGDESLFNDLPRRYQAICLCDTLMLTLSRTNLLTIISECPSVALGFLAVYTSPDYVRSRL